MPKTTAIDRAIKQINTQIAVLELAKQVLLDLAQPKKPKVSKPRALAPSA